MIDVLIGDRQFLFADLLSSLLSERGYRIVKSVEDPDDLVAEVGKQQPRVCLVDHRSFAGADRTLLLDALVGASCGRSKVVVVSIGPSLPEAADTPQALGVDGVFDKRASLQTLLDGLPLVLDGEIVTAGPAPARPASGRTAPARPASGRTAPGPRGGPTTPEDAAWYRHLAGSLTPRERECLAMLVEGRNTRAMQDALSVSVMTVRSHVRSLLRKLGAHSRLEATSLAVRYELLDDDVAGSRAG